MAGGRVGCGLADGLILHVEFVIRGHSPGLYKPGLFVLCGWEIRHSALGGTAGNLLRKSDGMGALPPIAWPSRSSMPIFYAVYGCVCV